MFLNESVACERIDDKKYEWSSRGFEATVHILFKRSKRWFILPAYITKDYIVWTIHHEFIIQKLFNNFVREQVLPLTTRAEADDINSILCLDNASAHKSDELQEMCDEADVTLIFLPSYSCDFNSIEISFAILKRWMKKHEQMNQDYESFEKFLKEAIKVQNDKHDSRNLFRAAGIEYSCCERVCN